VIGISTILAGDLDALGVPLAQAAELAGRGVAIDGHPLRFERANGACSAAGGADAARTLIADGAVAVVGPVCPAAVEAAQPLYAAAGIPVLSPSSTAIGSTQPAGRAPYANFFRLAYSDAIQATALAAFATSTLHAGSVYVVYFDDLYGVNLRDAFTTAFAGHIDGAAAFAAGATAFPSALQGIRDTQPDAVLYLGYEPEAVAFVRALRAAGLTMPLLAPDGVHDPQFVARAGTVANGTYVALPDPPLAGDAYARFSAAYRAAYGQPAEAAPFTAQAFDAATLVIDALRQVATPSGGALMVDEGALRAAIARADLAGASGHIRFDAAGNNVGTTTPVRILVVRDGAFQDVVP
jgi:branched-chain amino acid transport system substrate-binding protein